MAMIVGLHYFNSSMGGALGELSYTDFNFYIAYFLESAFIVGVNCFVLLTGYFQVNKTTVSFNKVTGLLAQIFFYSVVLYFVGVLFGDVSLSLVAFVKAAFPFFIGLKWFIKAYIILYLLSPFINKGLVQLDKKEFQSLLGIMLLFFSIWPSTLPSPPVEDAGYGIINFVLVYSIGGYLRKHPQKDRPKLLYLLGYVVCALVVFSAVTFAHIVLGGGVWIIWGYNFIFNIIGAVFLFLFFSKLEIKSKLINYIASFTFGVYLIHADPSITGILYGDILNTSKYWFSPWFIVHALLSILLVYTGCTIIDMSRKWLLDGAGKVLSSNEKENAK